MFGTVAAWYVLATFLVGVWRIFDALWIMPD